jgi:hypothetical protein
VRTKDTGTLQYDIYFNDDQSECIVLERCRDSEALIEHAAHLGDLTEAVQGTKGYQEVTAPGPTRRPPALRCSLRSTRRPGPCASRRTAGSRGRRRGRSLVPVAQKIAKDRRGHLVRCLDPVGPYTLSVVAASACPRRPATVRTGTPAASILVAAK